MDVDEHLVIKPVDRVVQRGVMQPELNPVRQLPVVGKPGRTRPATPPPIEYSRSRAASWLPSGSASNRRMRALVPALPASAGSQPECSSVRNSPANASTSILRCATLSKCVHQIARDVGAPSGRWRPAPRRSARHGSVRHAATGSPHPRRAARPCRTWSRANGVTSPVIHRWTLLLTRPAASASVSTLYPARAHRAAGAVHSPRSHDATARHVTEVNPRSDVCRCPVVA